MWRPVLLVSALLGGAAAASAQAPPGPLPASLARPGALPAVPAPGGRADAAAPGDGAGAPAVAPPPQETLQSFDSGLAELQWTDSRWQLVAGGVVLKDFGPRQEEARAALRLLRQLGLTQRGTVGTPRAVMEYWLAGGRAPQGLVPGLHPVALDVDSLRAEQVQGQWCVRDNSRVLFTFGAHGDEARQALAVIRRHGFTQVGSLGRGLPDMLVFLGGTTQLPGPARLTSATFPSRVVPPAHEAGPAIRQAGFSPDETAGGVVTAGLRQPAAGAGGSADQGPRQPFGAASLPFGRQPAGPNPTAAPGPEVDRVPLDWQHVEVKQDGSDWKLVAGNYTLANFGAHDTDARLALNVVRFYHFTEHGVVGAPRPLFSYFLSNGQAPHGYMMGVEHVPFHPDSLTVRQAGDAWLIYDGGRVLLNFGDHADEARQAVGIIRHYQFDTLCRVGRGDTGALTFFVRAR